MESPTVLYKGKETIVVDADEVEDYEKKGWKDEPPKKKDVKRD